MLCPNHVPQDSSFESPDALLHASSLVAMLGVSVGWELWKAGMRDARRSFPLAAIAFDFWFPYARPEVVERVAPWIAYRGGHLSVVAAE